jgi:perosamine synthetase
MENPLGDDVIASVLETLRRGHLYRYDVDRPEESEVARLEQRFSESIGTRYALGLNSCSSALFLALMAVGVSPGDEVLVPAFTFIAVPSAIIDARAKPVLVETTVDYAMDCADLERKITPRSRWLLLSYMRGHVPDLDRVLGLCRQRGIEVIEDVAHGLGVEWGGVPLGRFGRAAAFSFQSHKLVDAGEGGMLVTDDPEIASRAAVLADCKEGNWRKHIATQVEAARFEPLVNALPAYGLRMSSLTAAAILPQLSHVEERVERHNANYTSLAGLLARSSRVRVPVFSPRLRPACDNMQLDIPGLEPDQLRRFLTLAASRGVELGIYGLDPANARCYWNWTFFETGDCPQTRALLSRTVDMRLPLWLEKPHLELIAAVVLESLDAVS